MADNPADESMADQGDFANFADLLALGAKESSDGRSRLELHVRRRHLRSLDILHGGVAASLLDSAMGMAAASQAPDDHYVVTVQLNVNFIRPAWEGEILIATGEVVHGGRQTAVSRGEIRTDDEKLVATGSATFLYLPHSSKTRGKIARSPDR